MEFFIPQTIYFLIGSPEPPKTRVAVEQIVSRVVIFELGGERHMLIVDVADFGGEWRISQFGGNLGALRAVAPAMHGIIPPEFVDAILEEIDF